MFPNKKNKREPMTMLYLRRMNLLAMMAFIFCNSSCALQKEPTQVNQWQTCFLQGFRLKKWKQKSFASQENFTPEPAGQKNLLFLRAKWANHPLFELYNEWGIFYLTLPSKIAKGMSFTITEKNKGLFRKGSNSLNWKDWLLESGTWVRTIFVHSVNIAGKINVVDISPQRITLDLDVSISLKNKNNSKQELKGRTLFPVKKDDSNCFQEGS